MSTINHGISNHSFHNFKDDYKKKRAKKNRIDLYRITILSWLIFAATILIIYFVLMN